MTYTTDRMYFPSQQVREWTNDVTRIRACEAGRDKVRKINAEFLQNRMPSMTTDIKKRALRTIANLEA